MLEGIWIFLILKLKHKHVCTCIFQLWPALPQSRRPEVWNERWLLIIHTKTVPFVIFTTRDRECSQTSIKECRLCEVVVVIVYVFVDVECDAIWIQKVFRSIGVAGCEEVNLTEHIRSGSETNSFLDTVAKEERLQHKTS